MIKSLEIKNFKSIKHLSLECRRVNLFIGKPNAGKSNLLESVGLFSLPFVLTNNISAIREIIRLENATDLFHAHDLNEPVEVNTDKVSFQIKFEHGNFKASLREAGRDSDSFGFDLFLTGQIANTHTSFVSSFKFYRFAVMDKFARQEVEFLLPPKGENLSQILLTKKDLRKAVADFFSEYGFKMVLKQLEYKIEIQQEVEGVIISYPYSLVSDTLQRVVFHHAAIETNKDSTIIFEEPEAHSFPYYTKFLAERIALDSSNQYFVTTHNPYFLPSILEKTPKNDIAIFITYLKDYQTKLRPIAPEEMTEILDLDASVFFNLERFLGES
ncbi:MAG: AAA family ATPase [bacterium]